MKRYLLSLSAVAILGATTSPAFAAGGFLGVQLADEIPEAVLSHLGIEGGAMVLNLVPDSPAARASLQRHDVITRVGKIDVRSANDLRKAIGSQAAGSEVLLVVRRGGKTIELRATLGGAPGAQKAPPPKKKGFLGVQYGAVPPILAKHLKLEPDAGLVVLNALPGSGAANAGIEVDDVLLRVNGEKINAKQAQAPSAPGIWHPFQPGQPGATKPPILRFYRDEDGGGVDVDGDGDVDIEIPDPGSPSPDKNLRHFEPQSWTPFQHVESNLAGLIGKLHAGEVVTVDLIHRGDPKTVKVALGEAPASPPTGPSPRSRYNRLRFFGEPQAKTRGTIRWRDGNGVEQEHELEFGHDHGKLIERFKKHQAPSALIEELEKAIGKLETEIEEIAPHGLQNGKVDGIIKQLKKSKSNGTNRTTSSSSSTARVISNGIDVTVKTVDGVSTIDVTRNGQEVAKDLPYAKRDTLPADVQKILEGISVQHGQGGGSSSGSVKSSSKSSSEVTPKKLAPSEQEKKIKA